MELPVTRGIYDTLHRIKNTRIKRNIYTFQNKKKSNNYKQLLTYHLHKVSREFVYKISTTFSNLHGCGLFSYCVLLCNASTHYNPEIESVYAWVKNKPSFFLKIFNLKNIQEVFRQLQILKECNLIDYNFVNNEITVFMLEGNVEVKERRTRKQIIAEYAAIKSHTGYVFVNETNLEEILNLPHFYSEADIMMDLWLSTIYNDINVELSSTPVVYLNENRVNEEMNINVTTNQLSKRWKCSYGRVNKVLKKATKNNFIDIFVLANVGTVIFNKSYITFFAKKKYKEKCPLAIYKYFYKTTYMIKYLLYLFRNKLNFSNKINYLLEVIRFIKDVGFSPYIRRNNKDKKRLKKPFIMRIKDLLSLFNFKPGVKNSLFKRNMSLFYKIV